MAEPTSVLTFRTLILDVARKLGCGYYGADGDGAIQVPVDAHDLDMCQRIVNKAIRMFIADAPPNGWRWARPVAQVAVWGTASGAVATAAYDAQADKTTITNADDAFFESMEERALTLGDDSTLTISDYVSAKQVKVYGDATAKVGQTWRIAPDGNYTLPRTFAGQVNGAITYIADTNQGVSLEWTDESTVRQWRENVSDETGDPYWAAVRVMSTGTPRRRWELCVYPKPDETMVVEFPYTLGFDSMSDLDEVPPTPFSHDETIRAACLAVAERDEDDAPGPDWDYYRSVCLPNSYRIDAASAPRRLGYFGDPGSVSYAGPPIRAFRDLLYQRPRVTFNP